MNVKEICDSLNKFSALDSSLMSAMFDLRFNCNDMIAEICPTPAKCRKTLSVIGLINGILMDNNSEEILMFSRDTNTRAVKGFTVCTNPEHVPAATEEKDG